MNSWARVALGATTTGAATVAYAAGYERRRWTLREATVPVLPPGTRPLRILHVSDLHLTPGQESKKRWVSELASLEPDLVVNTGDNLAHPKAVPGVLTALGSLLEKPGLFVFGSNDYFGPTPKNPMRYLRPSERRIHGEPLPWRDLRAAFAEHGWQDATHQRVFLDLDGVRVGVSGVDDPHLALDRYDGVSGPITADLRLGLTHSPEPRVLDSFAADGYDLVLAGHTHGGQLRLPGYGALVTNCGIDRSRARGVSRWGAHMHLHVSAGLGTSPFAPVRFACPPEASLLTLVPRPARVRTEKAPPATASADVG
ncbi:metallophosphoesterase [Pseudonocardia sp. T1-2H]|uniref:metallophosphoesterase n=1 Tax=Pseudonocardia sp. T1-2H TaxID=3128899 RepID=UPI0031018776